MDPRRPEEAGAGESIGTPSPGAEAAAKPGADGIAPDASDAAAQAGGTAKEEGGLWTPEAEKELGKIPFFVRGKARRNTETYAREFGHATITMETLYDAKAHYAR